MSKWLSRKSNDGTKWLHPAETLLNGQVSYACKLFGSVDAAGSKGIDVVRDAMQKTKFNRQLLKADGVKCPKVELIISVDHVIIRNTKAKTVMNQFSLQQLSYCADDKAERRLFAFVARDNSTNSHRCFVFDSEKAAEEITLTIGQAFELAYRKYLEEKPLEAIKNVHVGELNDLKTENSILKQRISQLEGFLAAHGLQAPPISSNNNNDNGTLNCKTDRPRLGSTGSGTSNNTEPEQERYAALPTPSEAHILIESLSFSSQPQLQLNDENGKANESIPALPPPSVPVRAMTRSASSDNTQVAAPAAPVTSPVNAAVARPRPVPTKLPALSEKNPFKTAEFPPPVAPPTQPLGAQLSTSTPLNCLMDTAWSSAAPSHLAALADFDPLSMKTSN